MRLEELQDQVRACITDPTLTYRQRLVALAGLAENALEPPPVGDACRQAQLDGIVHDMGEGNAPYRPRYVLPDYAKLLRQGSEHLELPAPTTLAEAVDLLLVAYTQVPSITGYPVSLGDLDALLEPFTDGVDDATLRAELRRLWIAVDRTLPDAFVHANLGPAELRATRPALQVDAELRQVVPNLTLRVDPEVTPDSLVEQAVLTACADGKPHLVNHPMLAEALPTGYGVVSCYNSLPSPGGSYTLCRLNLRASVEAHEGTVDDYLERTLPHHVALTAELISSRVRFVVEQARWFEHDWLSREGLVQRGRFTAMFGVFGGAEAVELLLARTRTTARYGHDPAADDLMARLVARLAELVAAHEVPYCEATGGHALLHAQSGIDLDVGTTAGVRVPVGREPGLYRHIRTVAPHHVHFTAGISDVFTFDPAVRDNPRAVVDVLRGAFAQGMRDFTFDVVGNGFTRVTGYLVKRTDVAKVNDGARHSSTFLGATAIVNQKLDDRVVKRP